MMTIMPIKRINDVLLVLPFSALKDILHSPPTLVLRNLVPQLLPSILDTELAWYPCTAANKLLQRHAFPGIKLRTRNMEVRVNTG
jgi:hypothetical protein